MTFRQLVASWRAFSLPVSVLPVVLATAAVRPPDQWNWPVLALSVTGAALLHLAGNLLNDYFDFRSGVDRAMHDDTGRPGRLLVTGQLTPRVYLLEAIVCLLAAGTITALLAWRVGPGVLAFAAAAVVLLYAYTGPPFKLKYRGLGEGVVFVVFGPLLMAGAAWVQTRQLAPLALLLSVPAGLATAALLAGNNWRDRQEDARAGIVTLGRFAGGKVARIVYLVLVTLAATLPAALAATGLAPLALLACPVTLLLLVRPVRAVLADRRLANIDVHTARWETLLLGVMILACLLNDGG